MFTKFNLFIYSLCAALLLSLSAGLWYYSSKADSLTATNAVLVQTIDQEKVKNKQIIETIDKTREQIAALSADLSTVRDNVALIDMTAAAGPVVSKFFKPVFRLGRCTGKVF